MLVGMLKNPALYNPNRRIALTKERRNVVLSQMNRYEFISDSLFDTLKRRPIILDFKIASHNEGAAPYLREYLREYLKKWCAINTKPDGSNYNLYRDGSLLSVIPSQGELLYQDVFVEQGLVYEYCIESVNECGESSWTCASGTTAVGLIGDINLDQVIDVLDIVILLNFVLEITTPTSDEIWSSDINQDQILNVLDIVGLVNIILR